MSDRLTGNVTESTFDNDSSTNQLVKYIQQIMDVKYKNNAEIAYFD